MNSLTLEYSYWLPSPPDFTSWTIRHGAVLGLSRVCKVCRHVPMKDGLSNVAWTKLVERDSEEKDGRVLEAYKLSQVPVLICMGLIACREPVEQYYPLLISTQWANTKNKYWILQQQKLCAYTL